VIFELHRRAQDFDFLHGHWTVEHRRLRHRLVGADEWDSFAGPARCWSVLGGVGNVDEIELPPLSAVGMTVRLFDPSAGHWSLHWVSSLTGTFEPAVIGGFDGPVGRFYGDDVHDRRPIRVRYVWDEITDSSARWQQAFSVDGEHTWETNWVMCFTRARS
jgi:hypothetical protein